MIPRRVEILERLSGDVDLPRLSRLSADLGVSARTLRRDIAWLAANGCDVRIDRGRVRYVAPPESTPVKTAEESTPSVSDGWVGRVEEFSAAVDDLEAASTGAARVLVVSGEPGIGKTSFVREIAGSARDRGFVVAIGRATLDEGAPAFWPWIQILRSLNAHVQANGSDDLATEGKELVSNLMSDTSDTGEIDRIRSAGGHDFHAIRFRSFDRITQFLERVSDSGPVLLGIDDMQWCDTASLDLVRHATDSLINVPVLFAITIRDDESRYGDGVRRTLSEINRHPGHRRVSLSGLSAGDIGQMIDKRTGQPGNALVTDYVSAHSGGNPFFARELVEHLISRNLLYAQAIADLGSDQIPVPESIRDILESKLSVLSAESVTVLEVASLIGSEFDSALLADVVDGELAWKVESALSDGVTGRLIEESGEIAGRFAFAHALTHAAFVERQSPATRATVHARIGDAIEPAGDIPPGFNEAELVHHLGEAGSLVEPERLANSALRAGEHAMSTSAWVDALSHFETVIAALDRQDPTDSDSTKFIRARALDGAGFTRIATRSNIAAQTSAFAEMNEAFDLYLQLGDRKAAVALASHGWRWGWQTSLDHTRERAMELADEESEEYGWLISGYGFDVAYGRGELERASGLINKALEIAGQTGSRPLEARAMVDLMQVAWLGRDHEATARMYKNAHRLAFDLGDDALVAHIGLIGAIAGARVGNIDESIQTAMEALQSAARTDQSVFIYSDAAALQMLYRLRGDWEGMKRIEETLVRSDLGRRDSPLDYVFPYGAANCDIDVLIEDARSLLEETITRNPVPPILLGTASHVATLARLTSDDSLLNLLDRTLNEVERLAGHRWPTYRHSALHLAAEIAYIRGGRTLSEDDFGELDSFNTVVDPLTNTSTHHAKALAYELSGQLDRAEIEYNGALDDCRTYDLNPEFVWTSLDYASFLSNHRSAVSNERLTEVRTLGKKMANRLGMTAMVEKFDSPIGVANNSGRVQPAGRFGLSTREAEIARLVSEGLTNREISDRLVITLNTVQTHVSNILSKTGASNRTEAALLITGNGDRES